MNLKWIALAALLSFMFVAALSLGARSQPANQVFAVPMCPTGQVDANQNPYVVPCGYSFAPLAVQVIQDASAPPRQVQQCPANPISKKIPPLC